ncbi:MAG: DEAD/DEAH box helicase [Akkermansia sp.]
MTSFNNEVTILPSGLLRVDLPPFSRAFESSLGSGLLALGTASWPTSTGTSLYFLRGMVKEALTRLAHAHAECPNDDPAALLALLPTTETLQHILDGFPPILSIEFLTKQVIEGWFEALHALIAHELSIGQLTLADWLNQLGEPWNRIGHVFFHLAENKDDTTGGSPFAFLATFAHKASSSGQISHLPLGTALRVYESDHRALLALLQPLREAARHSRLLNALLETKEIFSPRAWSGAQAYAFLRDIPFFEEAGITVRMVNLWKKQAPRLQITVSAETNESESDSADQKTQEVENHFSVHSLLRFSMAATLGGRHLSPEELEELLQSGEGLIRFHGEWVAVDAQKIRQLLDRWGQATRMLNSIGIPLIQGLRLLVNGPNAKLPSLPASSGLELPEDDPDCLLTPGVLLTKALQSLQANGTHPTAPLLLTPLLDSCLRPYQRDGVIFLEQTTARGFGACLADDMGLGKTLQTLSWLSHRHAATHQQEASKAASPSLPLLPLLPLPPSLPSLIIAPASLLGNWEDEIARFTPHLRSIILHPSRLSLSEIKKLQRHPARFLSQWEIVITTYGMVGKLNQLSQLDFPAIILDEAQAIKNADSQRSRQIRELHSHRKVALSGTPVENNLSELWSLMAFLNPGLLGGKAPFDAFIKGMGSDYSPLKKLVRPFLLRRMKTDPGLVPDLPDKTEIPVYCDLTPHQAVLYRQEVEALRAVLDEPDPAQRLMLILPFLARFKQICNHPAQYLGTGEFLAEESGKLLRLQHLATQIAQRQEKLIIFTQFRSMIDPLHEILTNIYHRPGLVLHGGTPVGERQQLVSHFQQEEGPPFFVLSLKAAGTGLTLTQASHVIHFDRWWNPAVENQATDRAYRIGQHKNVLVHKFICKGTIEERIDDLLHRKQNLADNLFDGNVEKLLIHMSPQEIASLL